MSLFRKILEEYKEEEKRKYELANPCEHKKFKPFVWDGHTACTNCCKHEYRDLLETCDGETTCTLCWLCWTTPPVYSRARRRVRKRHIPKIRVSDENGRRRRVKYHKS